ncbi:MAG: phosphomannomutase/phosphoglucomutase, partial [Eubacteriales bacterium]
NFPNHIPNPEDSEAMKSISEAVCKNRADFGIIFDTDVDRAGAVDNSGNTISRNAMVALAASLLKNEGVSRTTVVTDSVTSNELTDFIENKLKFKHHRFKRGYKNVINESIALNERGIDSALAIETSGHGAFKENYFLDDGAYLATKIVIAAAKLKKHGKGIESLLEGFSEPLESLEVRVPINCENFTSIADKVIADMNFWLSEKSCGMSLAVPNYEGVRINFDTKDAKGWALIRKSLHESLMPINIESDIKGGAQVIAERIKKFLQNYKELDISKL